MSRFHSGGFLITFLITLGLVGCEKKDTNDFSDRMVQIIYREPMQFNCYGGDSPSQQEVCFGPASFYDILCVINNPSNPLPFTFDVTNIRRGPHPLEIVTNAMPFHGYYRFQTLQADRLVVAPHESRVPDNYRPYAFLIIDSSDFHPNEPSAPLSYKYDRGQPVQMIPQGDSISYYTDGFAQVSDFGRGYFRNHPAEPINRCP